MKALKEIIKDYLKNNAPEFSPEDLLYHRSMIEEKLASVISEALDEIEEELTAEEE